MNKTMNPLVIILFAFSSGATIVDAAPPGCSVNACTEYRFVGYSTTTTTGDAGGVLGMNARCQDDFGELARMCTTKEFWMSPQAAAPANSSWIHPVYVIAIPSSISTFEGTVVHDWTGAGILLKNDDSNSLPTCNQWRSGSPKYRGWQVDNTGGVLHNPCSATRQVTCCVPAGYEP